MSSSTGITERKKYLDAAKGWGILMVVFGHITSLGNPIDIWFGAYKLAVFCFGLSSGDAAEFSQDVDRRIHQEACQKSSDTLFWV